MHGNAPNEIKPNNDQWVNRETLEAHQEIGQVPFPVPDVAPIFIAEQVLRDHWRGCEHPDDLILVPVLRLKHCVMDRKYSEKTSEEQAKECAAKD